MRAGLVSSAAFHLGIIGFMAISFASPSPFDTPPQEAMPIDIISDAQMSQMMAGKKDAPKAEKPKPVVEKVDAPKPAENLDAKVDEKKPEVKAANEPPPPPPPPPPQAKPEPTPPKEQAQAKPPEPKPPAPQEQAKPQPPAPPKDAESLAAKPPEPKKEEPKPEQTAQAAPPAPSPPKKPKDIPPKVVQAPPKEQDNRKFDTNQIAALLDKRDPSRTAALGETINNTVPLGARMGTAAMLSQTELDALRARLMSLWNPPAGAANPQELIVTVRIQLNQDGTLSGPPRVITSGTSPFFTTARDSAIRAIFRGQPFDMLSPAKYDAWKDIEITFDPRDMVRG